MNTPDQITERPDLAPLARILGEFRGSFGHRIPRTRQLEVRDDHCLYLLTLVADDLLAKRQRGEPAGLPALEMQAALNEMLRS